MNPINNVGSSSPIQKALTPPAQKEAPAAAPQRPSLKDRLELSGVSHLLGALKSNDVRADKVADIKSQIAAGTYESDDKVDVAVHRLLDDLTK